MGPNPRRLAVAVLGAGWFALQFLVLPRIEPDFPADGRGSSALSDIAPREAARSPPRESAVRDRAPREAEPRETTPSAPAATDSSTSNLPPRPLNFP